MLWISENSHKMQFSFHLPWTLSYMKKSNYLELLVLCGSPCYSRDPVSMFWLTVSTEVP
jgi:hypothetical protein